MHILAVCGLAGLAQAASAQPDGSRAVDDALKACRAELNDVTRLRCYDAALDKAFGVDEAIVAKREEHKRQRFGLPVDDQGMRITELNATVRAVNDDLRRSVTVIELDNGQVWRLLSDGGLRATFKPGMAIVITETSMGGYRVRIPGKNGFRGIIRDH